MSEHFTEDRFETEDQPVRPPAPTKTPEHVDLLLDLHSSLSQMRRELATIARELHQGASRVEDLDLTAQNPNGSTAQQQASFDEAIQVDNPYDVWLEVRASRDGAGGQVIMRVPPRASRVQNVRVREVSLRALGTPAGATPATLIRFTRPQVNGIFPLLADTGDAYAKGKVANAVSIPAGTAPGFDLVTAGYRRLLVLWRMTGAAAGDLNPFVQTYEDDDLTSFPVSLQPTLSKAPALIGGVVRAFQNLDLYGADRVTIAVGNNNAAAQTATVVYYLQK